jgi:hypothetical protein
VCDFIETDKYELSYIYLFLCQNKEKITVLFFFLIKYLFLFVN